MSDRGTESSGFGLIEVIIAMLILALVAMALIPSLLRGLSESSNQSTTATATRHLNSIIESARMTPTCASLVELAAAPPAEYDGRGADLTVAAVITDPNRVDSVTKEEPVTLARCAAADAPHNQTLTLDLSVSDAGGVTLASTKALIFVR